MNEYQASRQDPSGKLPPRMFGLEKLIRVLSGVFLSTLLAACTASPPRILVEPAFQDLGERRQELLELTYTVRNEGGSPLEIQKISTSCGCTQAAMETNTIPPGGSAELKVTMDPIEDDLYGELMRVIYVRSNDPEDPEVEVEFRVEIRRPEG
jgi:hypothetical protein